jgi:hypothetical protein
MDWLKARKEPWHWHVSEIATGERAGQYVVASFGHSWNELDEYAARSSAANRRWSLEVEPYVAGATSSLFRLVEGASCPSRSADPAPLTQVAMYRVRAGENENFRRTIERLKYAAEEASVPRPFLWYELVTGGEAAFIMLTPKRNLADLEPQGTSHLDFAAKVHGPAEADLLRQSLRAAAAGPQNEMWRHRADLSHFGLANPPPKAPAPLSQDDRLRPVPIIRFVPFEPDDFLPLFHSKSGEPVEIEALNKAFRSRSFSALTLGTETAEDSQKREFYTWRGRLTEARLGRSFLAFSPLGAMGTVQWDSEVFTIDLVAGSNPLLLRITKQDQRDAPPEFPPRRKNSGGGDSGSEGEGEDVCNATGSRFSARPAAIASAAAAPDYPIRILGLFSEATPLGGYLSEPYKSMWEKILTLQIKTAFGVFETPSTGITAEVVFEGIEYDTTGISLGAALDWMYDAGSMVVAGKRKASEADFVCLFMKYGLPDGSGISVLNEDLTYDVCYSVVDWEWAASIYSFAHELGHLLGMRHDYGEREDGLGGCPYGHVMTMTGNPVGRTIMMGTAGLEYCASHGAYCARDLIFSRPGTTDGTTTGMGCDATGGAPVDAPADNFDWLKKHAATASRFSDDLPP